MTIKLGCSVGWLASLLLVGCAGAGASAAGAGRPDSEVPEAELRAPARSAGHPRILLNARERKRLQASLAAGDEGAARFAAMVDGQLGGADYYNFAAADAALLGQLTGKPRYCDYAIDRVERMVAAEEKAIAGGGRPAVSSDSYLGIGGMVGDAMLVYDWCHDRLTRGQRSRWSAWAHQAVWNVWHHREATWGGRPHAWSGWSVDDPGNNYYYSFLRATLLLGLAARGEDERAEAWITHFRQAKMQQQLVPYFVEKLVGGGSREGTGYGTAQGALFALVYLWEQSTLEPIEELRPTAQASLLFLIHQTVPTLDRIAPIGDHSRDSSAALFDYHRAYLEVLARLVAGSPEAAVARTFLDGCAVPKMGQPFNFASDFLFYPRGARAQPLSTLYPAYYSSGAGQVFLRSGWEPGATWANFSCGPYSENHAHHDQGQLTIYRREWLAIDENLHSHSGIRQQAEAHNLVRLERAGKTLPMRQGNAGRLLALHDQAELAYLAGDFTAMYQDPGVVGDLRQVVFLKPDVFVVLDRVETRGSDLRKVWQLSTSLKPGSPAATPVVIAGERSRLSLFPVSGRTPQLLAWPSLDPDLLGGWRLDVADASEGASIFLHVLAIDDAVKAAIRTGEGGVRLSLADGRTATVTLDATAAGGRVEITSPRGATSLTVALRATVETLPRFVQ